MRSGDATAAPAAAASAAGGALAALFLVSAGAIGFEIALTRFFAVALWSEYGYWVISIAMTGFAVSGVSFVLICWVLYQKLVLHDALEPGWASVMVAVLFLGGVQLITIGLIGEYVGRIHDEVKQRPLYLIQDEIGAHSPVEAL